MDCGTCESASPVIIQKPDVVNVNLTVTENAKSMLSCTFFSFASLGFKPADSVTALFALLVASLLYCL